MERVLLWLDELDDYVTLWLLRPVCLRRLSLRAALAAALTLALAERFAPSGTQAAALAAAAALALVLWAGAAAAETLRGARAASRDAGRLEMR